MKIICEKEKILKGINSVINGVASKTTMPVLEGILLQTNDNELKLIMTDESIIYVNPLFNGGYSTYEDGKSPYHHAQWIFDEPIDPDNISQVYINDNLIYEKE